jgi:hypothetical protein
VESRRAGRIYFEAAVTTGVEAGAMLAFFGFGTSGFLGVGEVGG